MLVVFGQKRVGFGFHFNMIANGNISNTVQTVIFCTLFGNSLIGKMIVVEVAMVYPSAVFVSVLVFSPSPELPPDGCCQPVENTL